MWIPFYRQRNRSQRLNDLPQITEPVSGKASTIITCIWGYLVQARLFIWIIPFNPQKHPMSRHCNPQIRDEKINAQKEVVLGSEPAAVSGVPRMVPSGLAPGLLPLVTVLQRCTGPSDLSSTLHLVMHFLQRWTFPRSSRGCSESQGQTPGLEEQRQPGCWMTEWVSSLVCMAKIRSQNCQAHTTIPANREVKGGGCQVQGQPEQDPDSKQKEFF